MSLAPGKRSRLLDKITAREAAAAEVKPTKAAAKAPAKKAAATKAK